MEGTEPAVERHTGAPIVALEVTVVKVVEEAPSGNPGLLAQDELVESGVSRDGR